jgi:hypothetical protein
VISSSTRPAAPLDSDLRLETGGSWAGTFAKVARALIKDILEDSEPVRDVTIVVESGFSRFDTYTGDVEFYEHNTVTFTDGYQLDVQDMVALSVAG